MREVFTLSDVNDYVVYKLGKIRLGFYRITFVDSVVFRYRLSIWTVR